MSKIIRITVLLLILMLNAEILVGQTLPGRRPPPDRRKEQQAATLARLGRIEEAVNLYLELLYRDPENTNLYFRVSSLMPGQENAATLLQVLDDLLVHQSGNQRLAAEKGRLLYILEKREAAVQEWNKLIKRKPKDRFVYTAISNSMLQAGATEAAIEILKAGRLELQDPAAFAFDMARLYTARQNFSEASMEYLAHLHLNPGMQDHIINQLIKMIDDETAFKSVENSFRSSIAKHPDDQVLQLALAKMYMHQKQYRKCVDMVLQVEDNTSFRLVMSMADDLAADHAWKYAAELYQFVSANSKERRQIGHALLQLAATHDARMNQSEEYESLASYFDRNEFLKLDIRFVNDEVASLERTLKLYDSLQTLLPSTDDAFQALFNVAELQLTVSGDVDRAVRSFTQVLQRSRNRELRLQAGDRLVDAWLAKGDTAVALESLEEVIRNTGADEDDPGIIISRIKIRLHQGDLPALKKELLNLSGAAMPSDPVFNDGLELLALLEGNGELEDEALKKYFGAEKLRQQHKLSEAVELLRSIGGGPETIADESALRAIQFLQILGEWSLYTDSMAEFLEKFPDSQWRPHVLIWQGEFLQYQQLNPEAAIPYYEEVIVNHSGYLGVESVRLRLRELIGSDS